MPQVYAALKMSMGSWNYYSVRMKMREVANEIKFAGEVSDDKTLDQAIQREIEEGRASKQIVNYLVKNEQRFFNSLVVAALGGNPVFNPIKVPDQFGWIEDTFDDVFGVLTFNDKLKTYALDGQHRLFAIKSLIEDTDRPSGFDDETINVIFVIPSDDMTRDEFLKSYRRLFSSLNRHAKPTDESTNIIMDEDDRFAIVTRRLFSDFDFFKWDGVEDNPRIDTKTKSKNISVSSTAWATLIALYRMNIDLLWDPEVQHEYGVSKKNHELFQKQPSDEEVDELYEYLEKIWDAILINIPELENAPARMRKSGEDGTGEYQDHLFFRPIGQTDILAPISRMLLNKSEINKDSHADDFVRALKPLSYVNWNLQWCAWRDLLTIKNPDGNWIMRNEERADALKQAKRVLQWLVGCIDVDEDNLETLKNDWSLRLQLNDESRDEREYETFNELMNLREKILRECY